MVFVPLIVVVIVIGEGFACQLDTASFLSQNDMSYVTVQPPLVETEFLGQLRPQTEFGNEGGERLLSYVSELV